MPSCSRPVERPLVVHARRRARRRQAAFLTAFVELGTVGAACRRVGVGRRTVYDWAERDEAFANPFQEAREAVADLLEQECRRRAMMGTAEPVFHEGQPVGVRHRYSDLCLLVLLRAYRPERFRRPSDTGPKETLSKSTVVEVSYECVPGSADRS